MKPIENMVQPLDELLGKSVAGMMPGSETENDTSRWQVFTTTVSATQQAPVMQSSPGQNPFGDNPSDKYNGRERGGRPKADPFYDRNNDLPRRPPMQQGRRQ